MSTPPASSAAPAADPFAAVAALPGVPEAVESARKAVDALLGHRSMRRRSPEVSAESALRGARASAALEGADWALEEIRRRTDYSARAGAAGDREAAVVAGALRVSAEFGTLDEVWRRSPVQVLARLHVVAAADVVVPEELGRPRVGAEQPAPVEAAAGLPAPGPDEVAGRLEALAGLLAAPTSAPALVVAALTHGEILALRPFVWGNGVVARAAERLVLVTRGFDVKSAAAPEVGHVELGGDAYARRLAGYASGTPEGVGAWVAYCAEAVVLGARESVAVCEAVMRGI